MSVIDLPRRWPRRVLIAVAALVFSCFATPSSAASKRVAPRFPPLERSEVEAIVEAARPEVQRCLDASLSRGTVSVRARLSIVRWRGPSVALRTRAPGRDPVVEACVDGALNPPLSALLAERYAWHPVAVTLRVRSSRLEAADTAARTAIRRAVPRLRACLVAGAAPIDIDIDIASDAHVTIRGADDAAPQACLDEVVRETLTETGPATGVIAVRLTAPRARR